MPRQKHNSSTNGTLSVNAAPTSGLLADPMVVNRLTTTINQFVSNAAQLPFLRGYPRVGDPRRDIEDECGYPRLSDQVNPEQYWQLYDRDPIAARVVELMPKACWQVQPLVYEDPDEATVTQFEKAWDELGAGLRGTSWFTSEQGSPVWSYLCRVDILSRIGRFGVLLFGLDDVKSLEDLRKPVAGVEEYNSMPAASKEKDNKPKEELLDVQTRGNGTGKEPTDKQPGNTASLESAKKPAGKFSLKGNYALVVNRNGKRTPVFGKDPNPDQVAPADAQNPDQEQTDAQDAEQPDQVKQDVDPETGEPAVPELPPFEPANRLIYLRAFPEHLCLITQWETNPTSPRLGQPVEYQLTFNDPREFSGGIGSPMSTVRVHWTRALHVCDNHHQATSSEVFAPPVMRCVLNNLLGLHKLYATSPEAYYKACFNIIAAETHPQLGGDVVVDEGKMKDMFENMMNGLQRYGVFRGMHLNSVAPSVVDPTPHIQSQLQAVAIKTGIPMRKLMGSERGELASGQDDGDWNDTIRERDNNYLIPSLIRRFVDRCIMFGSLPEPVEVFCEWPDPENHDDAGKAEVLAKRVGAFAQYVSGGVEALIPPLYFLTREAGIPEEEVEEMLEAALAIKESEFNAQKTMGNVPPNQPPQLDEDGNPIPPEEGEGNVPGKDGQAPNQPPGAAQPGAPPGQKGPPQPLGKGPQATPQVDAKGKPLPPANAPPAATQFPKPPVIPERFGKAPSVEAPPADDKKRPTR